MIFYWNISPPELSVSTFQWDENRILQMIGRDRNTIINYDCLLLNVFSGSFWIKAEATRGDHNRSPSVVEAENRKPQWKAWEDQTTREIFLQNNILRKDSPWDKVETWEITKNRIIQARGERWAKRMNSYLEPRESRRLENVFKERVISKIYIAKESNHLVKEQSESREYEFIPRAARVT